MSDTPPAGGLRGLEFALARFADAVLAMAVTRGRLASLEFVEERDRLLRRLVMAALGALLLSLALLFAGLLVVAAFWDTHRLAAVAITGLAFLAAGGALVWGASRAGPEGSSPFAATLAELEKDRAWFARHGVPGEGREG